MSEGKFDIAAHFLDEFLKSEPTDADFLEFEKKYGTTVFELLRTVPQYSDDPATEKKIRANIEGAEQARQDATAKVLYNPERCQKYVRNLGATYEEKMFAQQELKRTGEYAVPFLIDAIRTNPDEDLYAGILDTIPYSKAHDGRVGRGARWAARDRLPGVLAHSRSAVTC